MRTALLLAVAIIASPACVHARSDRIFVGYDALWQTLPGRVFTIADERPLGDSQDGDGQAFRAWGPRRRVDDRAAATGHRVAWLGADIEIDGRAFPFSRATVFAGEPPGEPGADARLFVGARDVCLQGTPPSASGTAQRHSHVAVVVDAFTPRARRYDLPSLFGSCLALTRDTPAGMAFLAGAYHVPAGSEVSDGLDFARWRLRDGRFAPIAARPLRIRFVDPQDVYRFSRQTP